MPKLLIRRQTPELTPRAPPEPTYDQLTGPTRKRRRTQKPAAVRQSPRKRQQRANHARLYYR
jgi:hypothetical protein